MPRTQSQRQQALYSGFAMKPDLGSLKTQPMEYQFLQNVRGRGGLGQKRQCVKATATFTSGVMGLFDMKQDDDVNSPNKFLVVTGNTFYIFDPLEFLNVYTILFTSDLAFQAPDLTWWKLIIDSNLDYTTTQISAPSTTISSDLNTFYGDIIGFQNGTTEFLSFDVESFQLNVHSLPFGGAINEYTTTQAFTTGYGIIFQDATLNKYKLGVINDGIITLTQI